MLPYRSFGLPAGPKDTAAQSVKSRSGSRIPSKTTSAGAERVETSSSYDKPTEKKVSKLQRKRPEPEQKKSMSVSQGSGLKPRKNEGTLQASSSRTQDPSGRPSPTSPYSVDAYSTATPSLGSGSSASTHDSPMSNSLRRKPPIIGRYMSQKHSKSALKQGKSGPTSEPTHNIHHKDIDESHDYAISVATEYSAKQASNFVDDRPRSSQDRELHNAQTFVPPQSSTTPISNSSVTPSLRHTDSAGAFSHTTTPTSQTCYSPLMSTSPHFGPHAWTSPSKSPLGLPPSVVEDTKIKVASATRNAVAASEIAPTGRSRSRSGDSRIPATKNQGRATPVRIRDAATGHVEGTFKAASGLEKVSDRSDSGEIPIRPPPELAHLMETEANQSAESRPPSRPSRDGTSKLHVSRDPSPVIISNLSRSYTLQQKRRSSSSVAESAGSSRSASTGVQSPQSSTQPSRKPSQSQPSRSKIPQEAVPVPSKTSVPVNDEPENEHPLNDSQVSSPPVKSGSRFGFFSRKHKTETTSGAQESSKSMKKGPMAGTGHEGYSKSSSRRRSGGSVSGAAIATQTASTGPKSAALQRKGSNNSTESDLDDFLKQRLNPVYIRGDGTTSDQEITHQEPFRRGGSQDTAGSEPTMPSMVSSPETSHTSQSSFGLPRGARAIPVSTNTSMSSKASRPVHTGELASRDTSQSPTKIATRQQLPRPKKPEHSPSIGTASDTSQNVSSFEDQRSHIPELGSKAKKSNWSLFSRQSKSSQKWNPFHRAHTVPPKEINDNVLSHSASRSSDDYAAPHMAHFPAPDAMRSVAHYALLDSENEEQIAFEDLETMMEEAAAADDGADIEYVPHAISDDYEQFTQGTYHEEQFPIFAPSIYESPEVSQISFSIPSDEPARQTTQEEHRHQNTKPSRLAHVGRIPKVVSKRDRDRTLPSDSFSRPFARQPRPSISSPDMSSQNSTFSPPSIAHEFSETDGLIFNHVDEGSRNSSTSQQENERSVAKNGTAYDIGSADFMTFPRNNSDLSYSSSSGTFYFPTSQATAIIPPIGSPPSEDEVWSEYDDLIDLVLTPTISNTSQAGLSLPNKSSHSQEWDNELTPKNVSFKSKGSPSRHLGSKDAVPPPLFAPSSSNGTELLSPAARNAAMNSPSSVYSDPKHDSGRLKSKASNVSNLSTLTSKSSLEPPKTAIKTTSPTIPPASVPEIAAQIKLNRESQESHPSPALSQTQESQDSNGPLKSTNMANLRFGALMTSKWLSFGRVLFSPAHFDLGNTDEDRILVVDGLGKDWSYYCALSYPNATVYNIGPESSTSSQRNSLGTWQSLPNHRHVTHYDTSAHFPFPKAFFSVVVLRFPVAASEATLKATIGECKRVLRPGGYIEVSSLDLDLANMGNNARRAVRALKMKMQRTIPDVSLKPASDNMQRLLGRRGFENLNRCLLGVPVAGIVGSPSRSLDETDPSFTELIKDQSAAGDEGITKMVGRVGRWWYTRCYETCVLNPDGPPGPDLSQSIWNDRTLLKECEKLQTTFRLLVCYAQKPTVATRRAVSL